MDTARNGRILVIDDNEASAKVMCLVLSLHGYDSREAHNGTQAVEIAKRFSPQVALVDLGMPIMDGFEVAKNLQQILGPNVILIAVTGWNGEEAMARTINAGFRRHLVKPVESDAIVRLLTEFGFPPVRSNSGQSAVGSRQI